MNTHVYHLSLLGIIAIVPIILGTLLQTAAVSEKLPKLIQSQIQFSLDKTSERNETFGDDSAQIYILYLNTYCKANYLLGKHDCLPGNDTCDIDYTTLSCYKPSYRFSFDPVKVFDPDGTIESKEQAQCTKNLNKYKLRAKQTRQMVTAIMAFYATVLLIAVYIIAFPFWYPWFLPPLVVRAYIYIAVFLAVILSFAVYATDVKTTGSLRNTLSCCLNMETPDVLVSNSFPNTSPPSKGMWFGFIACGFVSAMFALQYLCCMGISSQKYNGSYYYWVGFDGTVGHHAGFGQGGDGGGDRGGGGGGGGGC